MANRSGPFAPAALAIGLMVGLTAGLLAAPPARAQVMQAPAPRTPEPIPVNPPPAAEAPINEAIAFNRTERWLIPFYFDKEYGNRRHAARGKRNTRAAPASFEKAPEIGDVLTAAQIADLPRLPGPLVRDLPPRRPDTQRYVAGPDVLLVQQSTGKVLDKLGGVVR
ncbi:MAG TPA: hypothetical protein VF194_11900 [Ferrovibrio sp.]|jgi:hypothetical protein|uniref:hypothetical protein n=1 Tax=Ferrovibrio sp. TaxID=1917215 RepID=UPI002ED26748